MYTDLSLEAPDDVHAHGACRWKMVLQSNKAHDLTPSGVSRLMGLEESDTGKKSLTLLEASAFKHREMLDKRANRKWNNWLKLFSLAGLFVVSYLGSGLTKRISGVMAFGTWATGLVCLLLTFIPAAYVLNIAHGGFEMGILFRLMILLVVWKSVLDNGSYIVEEPLCNSTSLLL